MKLEAIYFWAYHFKKFWRQYAPDHCWSWNTLCTFIKYSKSPYHIFDDWVEAENHPAREEWYLIVDNLLSEMNRK